MMRESVRSFVVGIVIAKRWMGSRDLLLIVAGRRLKLSKKLGIVVFVY